MIYEIMKRINTKGAEVMVYGSALEDDTTFFVSREVNDLDAFKAQADAIIAIRYDAVLDDMQGRIYTGILRGIKQKCLFHAGMKYHCINSPIDRKETKDEMAILNSFLAAYQCSSILQLEQKNK